MMRASAATGRLAVRQHMAAVGLLAALTTTVTAAAAPVAVIAVGAPPPVRSFQFAVIGHSFQSGPDVSVLRRAITDAGQGAPAFMVATGIKASNEPCSDSLYAQRRALLNQAAAPMIVSLAGSDWSACLNSVGRSNAIERLNRLRELFYGDAESLGERRLPLTRLSASAKFRSYAENAHWEVGQVLFATINLPANNNHFRAEAGRNSEYEDRLVANRAWLHRLFALAQRQKLQGVVLFSDGDPGVQAETGLAALLPSFASKQDGYAEPRRQLRAMADKFQGKLLLIDSQSGAGTEPTIAWRGNVGHLSLAGAWAEVRVTPGSATLFTLKGSAADATP